MTDQDPFYLQLLQRRWCVISVEQPSPQRMLWKPTGKRTQVLYKTCTNAHTYCYVSPGHHALTCWVNHDYRTCECWSKLACHAGRVKLFLSLCSIIYQHGGGRPSHISPTNICWHPGPLHATSPQWQPYSASITVSQMLFSSAAWERLRSYLPYTHAHRHTRYHNAPFIVFTIFKLRKSFSRPASVCH